MEVRVGDFVKEHIKNIVDYLNKYPDHLNDLTDSEYSKKIFGLSFAFMGEKKDFYDLKRNSYRCWLGQSYRFIKGDKTYCFCSEFGGSKKNKAGKTISEKHGGKFKEYLEEKGLLLEKYKNKDILFIVGKKNDSTDIKEEQKMKSEQEQITPCQMLPKNQILYGPPGTGKTYSTVGHALKILQATDREDSLKSFGKLKEEFGSQVEFVTFHQSFSYEDFVEGLKATTENGQIFYRVEDGVFKEICNNASSKQELEVNLGDIDLDRKIWKMSLGNSSNGDDEVYFDEAKDTSSLVLGWGGDIDFTGCNNLNNIKKKLPGNPDGARIINSFINKMKVNDLVIISDGNRRFKAIAKITGNYTYDEGSDLPQKRKIEWIQLFSPSKSVLEISAKYFTQMTINEPQHIDKEKLKQVLENTPSQGNSKKPHVLIIDEINRGNISRIFGELITLIEPSKRAGQSEEISVMLPYSKNSFSVPDNLFIIGTMNTADRSLAQLDLALRRRFEFIEMMPDYSMISENIGGVNLRKLLEAMNSRICQILDREHQIGHSFLMNIKTFKELQSIFKKQILPLLEEYFFDDWEKIKLVLNDDEDIFYPKNTFGDWAIEGMNNTPFKRLENWIDLDKVYFENIYKSSV
ncbi:MAG TPA: restriction endonuclease [Flavobacteriaceae bacterium]|jgi:5-methylcytosine-specific restriction protein B|nr:restriction endonuclease [Flavobacteriaceae bacterium]